MEKTKTVIEDTELITCNDCNLDFEAESTQSIDGNDICQSCFENEYTLCEECEEYTNNDDIRFVDNTNKYVCDCCIDDNYSYCDSCGEYVINADMSGDYDLCQSCYDDCHTYCDDCDEDYNHYEYSECPECSDRVIHPYDYRPEPNFLTTNYAPNTLFLGVELELSTKGDKDDLAIEVEALFNADTTNGEIVYLKKDGSVDNGFEIVTHPINAKEFFNYFNVDNLDKIRELGGRSWDSSSTCGIHTHYSLAAFDRLHMYTFTKFIFDNEDFMTKFARRSTHYAQFNKAHRGESSISMAYAKGRKNDNRYLALNAQNDHTLELRIFRGTLNKESFKCIIEFCNVLFDYTKTITVKNIIENTMTVEGLIEFTRSHSLDYPHLINHNLFTEREVN